MRNFLKIQPLVLECFSFGNKETEDTCNAD